MGSDVAATGRENFINGLQGRVAGVEVTSSSAFRAPRRPSRFAASARSARSNQPLMIIDGLPLDNKTTQHQSAGF
jgi:hypothetical protein